MTTTVSGTTPVLQCASLREFFRESVDVAMQTNQVSVADHTAHYVVNLLTLFSRSEQFFDAADDGPGIRPLALMLADAVAAPTPQERNFGLQRLGDVSLFVAGFFAEALENSAVDIDYYIGMGGGAYRTLAGQVRGTRRAEAFGPVFTELADNFLPLVDVLNDIRESARSANDSNILRLYEIWLKTGSKRAARLLRQIGVDPSQAALSVNGH